MLKALQFKIKVFVAYFKSVFFPDKEELAEMKNLNLQEWHAKRNWFFRYIYYTVSDLAVVDNRTGYYTHTNMPRPFHIPGRIYWWFSDKHHHRI